MTQHMTFVGWGLVGEPADGLLVPGPAGLTLDVTGYSADDYWQGSEFLGPDDHGIVPIYETADGVQFPPGAKRYLDYLS